MAETFNLNHFLQTYKNNTYDPTNRNAAAEKNMEDKRVENAKSAISSNTLLSLTLSEKMAELGIGERVIEQLTDTAIGIFTDTINPLTEYLNKYENIFDQNVYNAEIQTYAKQMFFASQAMREDAEERNVGQKFVYDM